MYIIFTSVQSQWTFIWIRFAVWPTNGTVFLRTHFITIYKCVYIAINKWFCYYFSNYKLNMRPTGNIMSSIAYHNPFQISDNAFLKIPRGKCMQLFRHHCYSMIPSFHTQAPYLHIRYLRTFPCILDLKITLKNIRGWVKIDW